MSLIASTSILSFMIALSIGETWWPLLIAFFSLVTPMPLLCGLIGDGNDLNADWAQDDDDISSDIGWFIFGALFVSNIGCTLVLARNKLIEMRIAWMSVTGAWCASFTIIGFIFLVIRKKI